MTRKDYVMIAEIIANLDEIADADTIGAMAEMFAENLAMENPRFDRARFIKACGVAL